METIGIGVDEAGPVVGQLGGRQDLALAVEVVGAVAVDLAHRRVERDRDVVARGEAGSFDRLDQQLDRVLVGVEVGREATLVADRGGEALVVQHLLEHVVRLRAPTQRLAERRRADRHDHELLEVDRVVGVHAAVEHVHHRHRQHMGVDAADVPVERDLELVGGRLGDGEAGARGWRWHRCGSCCRCRRGRAVRGRSRAGRAHRTRRARLRSRRSRSRRRSRTPLPHVAVAAVAELDRLVLAGGGAARHRSSADRARDRARHRPRRWGCRGSRGSRGRRRGRSRHRPDTVPGRRRSSSGSGISPVGSGPRQRCRRAAASLGGIGQHREVVVDHVEQPRDRCRSARSRTTGARGAGGRSRPPRGARTSRAGIAAMTGSNTWSSQRTAATLSGTGRSDWRLQPCAVARRCPGACGAPGSRRRRGRSGSRAARRGTRARRPCGMKLTDTSSSFVDDLHLVDVEPELVQTVEPTLHRHHVADRRRLPPSGARSTAPRSGP